MCECGLGVRHSFLKHKNAPLVASASSLLAKLTSERASERASRKDNMQSRRNLIKIIKARKKQDHKYILHQANILLSKCFERLEKLKQYDVVSGIADFKDCAFTDECDHLIKQQASEQKG